MVASGAAARLEALYVDPTAWRRGLASALADAALATLGDALAPSATVEVRSAVGNTCADAFYAATGWAPVPGTETHDWGVFTITERCWVRPLTGAAGRGAP